MDVIFPRVNIGPPIHEMKATEHLYPMVLFMILYRVFLAFESSSVTIQMKATEQYFPVVLFIMLYKVFLDFESVDKICKCYNSNESY